MQKPLSRDQALELETLIDQTSLAGVLNALQTICHEKGEHVSTNWQDKPLAKLWHESAARLSAAIITAEQLP